MRQGEEILGIALPITEEQKSRMNKDGFILYPKYPDLEPYKDIFGLDSLIKHKHALEWDMTTLYNSIYSNYINKDNELRGKTEDLVFALNKLLEMKAQLDKAISIMIKRHRKDVK